MWLMTVYVGLMVVGDFVDYFIGTIVEQRWPAASLPVFLGLYFVFLWVSWILAVMITEPRTAR